MEFLQENTLLYNIAAGVVVLVLFFLIWKLIKSVSKTVLIIIGIVIVLYGIVRFFPEVASPAIDFLTNGKSGNE